MPDDFFLYTQIITITLFGVSEILSYSSCSGNGILHALFRCAGCRIYVDVNIEQGEEET